MKVLSLREQRQETMHNYLDQIDTLYEGLVFKPYWNQAYYPDGTLSNYHDVLIESIKERITDRVYNTIKDKMKPNKAKAEYERLLNEKPPSKQFVVKEALAPRNGISKKKETLASMKMLAKCQTNYMQVILGKVDRKSKPIKKQSKVASRYL